MNEQDVVRHVVAWLRRNEWEVERANHRGPGFDIEASQYGQRWYIEAKGDSGDSGNNYTKFHEAIGQVVNRRNDSRAKYSVAFPAGGGYPRYWNKRPKAGRYPVNSCLFVSADGTVRELN